MDSETYGKLRTCLWRENDVLLFGRLIYGEARGQPVAERIAVAHVVRNRTLRPGWWGKSLKEVCLCRKQFSCFNQGDPNFPRLIDVKLDDPIFLECAGISGIVAAGALPDPTDGATHYHSRDVVPYWIQRMECVHQTKHFKFYRETV